VAVLVMLTLQMPLWQLAVSMTIVAALLFRDSQDDQRWRWRLRAFVGMALLCVLGDVWFARENPPAASLVFLPTVIFFDCMLDELKAALVLCGVALALVVGADLSQGPAYAPMHDTLLLIIPTLLAVSAATLPMYRELLDDLHTESLQLHEGLSAYRRLISTFFHDLANPLAVLSALAHLPAALQTPDDAQRAQRMAGRMDAVAQAARQAMLGSSPKVGRTNLSQLADELYDVFKERLQEKELRWVLNAGPDLPLAQAGPLLRDSILGNLLSNAVKFSPTGGRIELSGFETDGAAHLILSDTGRGIPDDVIEDLAQGRVPKTRPGTDGETGTGYGLLLAQTYMQELGGRLVLRPRRDGGTEAELILPLV
jgi:signal transduction histidine kinase